MLGAKPGIVRLLLGFSCERCLTQGSAACVGAGAGQLSVPLTCTAERMLKRGSVLGVRANGVFWIKSDPMRGGHMGLQEAAMGRSFTPANVHSVLALVGLLSGSS